jgi:hypothetical protein
MLFTLVLNTSGGGRTHGLPLRRRTPYPFGHGGFNICSVNFVFLCYHYTTTPRDSQESNLVLSIVSQMRKSVAVNSLKFDSSRV